MLINLVPDFFAVLASSDPASAYGRYFASHQRILSSYWYNYAVDPDSSHFDEVVRLAATADRGDLLAMLDRTDVVALARDAEERSKVLLGADVDVDVVLMVGVGGANAGELVIEGRGVAFVCLEHFTGVANPTTHGLGLDPALIPMWLAHEITHTIRYTSPSSNAELRQAIHDAGGHYSYWDTARRVSLRELIVNEGLAVEASRAVSPGHAEWEYFGYGRREYARIRELEPTITQILERDLDRSGLGLRLRYLSGGLSDEARTAGPHVLPERTGYYIGSRMVASAIASRGYPWAVRARADELLADFTTAATA